MNASYSNIEQLPGKKHLTGYGGGFVWKIFKDRREWNAICNGDQPNYSFRWIHCRTLEEVNTWLVNAKHDELVAERLKITK
jgi:hypothetical protein